MTSIDSLVAKFEPGDQRAIARLATLIENSDEYARAISSRIYARTGNAHVVGVTGSTGVGKSSLLRGLLASIVDLGRTAAVVAIDPTSPVSHGATLGDRIRMSEMSMAPGVFIRSVASRGRKDGLSPSAAGLVQLFDAAGFNYVFVETVGAGQDQYEIAGLAHTIVLIQVPGTGDSVQLLKAGVMEVADIYVVNKADLPGAQRVARDLRTVLGLADHKVDTWDTPIALCSAENGTGFNKLLESIDEHRRYLQETTLFEERTVKIARSEILRSANEMVQMRIEEDAVVFAELTKQVAARTLTPETAAAEIIRRAAQSGERAR